MTLTAAIVLSMAVTGALAFWAWRLPARFPRVATLVVVAVPLALLVEMLRGRNASLSSQSLQVVGQYAFLLDTLRIGSGSGADVRIPAPNNGRSGTGLVSVHVGPNDTSVVVRAEAGAPPVVAGQRVLAAAAVGRSASISLSRSAAAASTVHAAMPWWPIGCTTRIARLCNERTLTTGGVSVRVRASESGAWSDAFGPAFARIPTFVLFRRDGHVYIAAGSGTALTVNGAPTLTEARVASGAIEIGIGRESSRLRVTADRRANRMHVLFAGRLLGDRWPLHAGADRAVHRVQYGASASPGTLPLIDLNGVPLGAGASPYAGALEWAPGRWRWHADGQVRSIAVGQTVLMPGTGSTRSERGHLVRLAAEIATEGTLTRLAIVWLLGALLLAASAGSALGPVPALRLAVLGLAYTLAMVRSTIAIRVATSEPFNAEAVPTTLVFLIAFPVLVWLL